MTRFVSTSRLAVLSLLVVAMAACGKPQAAESKSQLSAAENEASKASPPTSNESVQGSLATSDQTLPDGSYYDRYTINARSGEQLTITLESGEFDAFLLLYKQGPSAAEKLADDDDGAGGTNAQIVHDVTSDGTGT